MDKIYKVECDGIIYENEIDFIVNKIHKSNIENNRPTNHIYVRYVEAVKYFNNGEYKKAISLFKKTTNFQTTPVHLAFCYRYGKGVRQSEKNALDVICPCKGRNEL